MKQLRRNIFAWFAKRPNLRGWAMLAPGILFLIIFFLIPLLMMFGYSFMDRDQYGNVQWGFSFDHYARFADELYLKIVWRSFKYAIWCTIACLLLGYPVAYTISRAGRWKNLLMFLVVIPFWTSFLVRTFAMIFMMRGSGLINKVLGYVGMAPWEMLFTPSAVIAGLVYGFLPFMILPIYTSLEKIDMSLLEAAEVLGAKPFARFFKVILPLSLPGVVAGSLLVFIPALGSYLTSDLLGGAKEMMIGNLVQNQFTAARNKPFGSAASFIMMAMVLVGVLYYLRSRDKEESQS